MKYFIPIDRSTIRSNPDFGRTEKANNQIAPTISFSGYNIPESILKDPEVLLSSKSYDGFDWKYEGYLTSERLIDKFKSIQGSRIIIKDHSERVVDVREYLFDFEDIEVECEHCHAIVNSSDVIPGEHWDEEGYYHVTENVCPECNASDCCEFEYEDINDII